ncbi:Polyketide cyclase / dehydrase and lipid transport [Planctomycetes bacterium Poly30]|uniref:Polyketide cyclase / dehydrase and lipid transport n=1 Tax=Saltatorellus ferox TaxID=2528018 RepID=A0A518EVV0_9BACT|nr:Polyketide cyclase / dehydrase and lipid transport [Planctomycetes bacterium Poly30]
MNKIIGVILTLVIAFGFLVPQLFLSKSFAMDRGTVIAAPVEVVHATVADFATWKDWTVWNKEADPTLQYTYTGEPNTVGHSMAWTAEKLGNGKLTFTSIEPGRIAYDMEFDGQDPAQGAMVMEPAIGAEGSTAARWEFSGTMEGMPYKRYFGLFMDKMIGPDFEKGLAGLKALVESKK